MTRMVRIVPAEPTEEEIARVLRWLRYKHDSEVREGTTCVVCRRFGKVYRRKLNSAMAASLVEMYRACGTDWGKMGKLVTSRSGDYAKLRWWGLVEPSGEEALDGNSAGDWRVTEKGAQFIRGAITVPSHAMVYNNHCIDLDDDMQLTIQEALGSKFNLKELMGA